MQKMRQTEYIGETKRHLHQLLGEHRLSILNYGHFLNPTPISEHLIKPTTLSTTSFLFA